MKILLEEIKMTNKEYAARLLNSVRKKTTFMIEHMDEEVDEEIIISEISNCIAFLENAVKALNG